MTKEKNELSVIEKEIPSMYEKATSVAIHDSKSMQKATEVLSFLNKQADRVKTEKEKVTKPLNEALKAERARWKPIEVQLEDAIGIVRREMTAYQTEQSRIAEEKKDKIANRVGAGTGKLKMETAVRKMGEVDEPEKSVSTDAGTVKFRKVQKFEVVDLKKVPVEYLLPNETAIRAAMKAGTEIPGVRYFTEEIPTNFR